MAVADTRIVSAPGNILTEHGPKLLPITVVCRQPGQSGFLDMEAYRADVGFAYSGSTLSALAAHALSTTLLSKLGGNKGTPPPPLSEIAYFIGGASAQYMREVCQLSAQRGLFSAIVFGWCPEQRRLRTFTLTPLYGDGQPLRVEVIERELQPIRGGGSADQSVVVIGSAPDLLKKEIDGELADAHARGDTSDIVAFDAPKRSLKRLIERAANEMVGGSVQQAWATQDGFQIVSSVEPIAPKPPSPRNAGLFVLGFDTLDLRNVGHYQIIAEGR
jgi:hypothetical protein